MIRKYRQLQPAVGGDVLRCKFDVQKALAWKKKIGSTQSHLEWPPCRVVWSVSQLLYLLQRAGHFKFLVHHFFVGLELAVVRSLYITYNSNEITRVFGLLGRCGAPGAFLIWIDWIHEDVLDFLDVPSPLPVGHIAYD